MGEVENANVLETERTHKPRDGQFMWQVRGKFVLSSQLMQGKSKGQNSSRVGCIYSWRVQWIGVAWYHLIVLLSITHSKKCLPDRSKENWIPSTAQSFQGWEPFRDLGIWLGSVVITPKLVHRTLKALETHIHLWCLGQTL